MVYYLGRFLVSVAAVVKRQWMETLPTFTHFGFFLTTLIKYHYSCLQKSFAFLKFYCSIVLHPWIWASSFEQRFSLQILHCHVNLGWYLWEYYVISLLTLWNVLTKVYIVLSLSLSLDYINTEILSFLLPKAESALSFNTDERGSWWHQQLFKISSGLPQR